MRPDGRMTAALAGLLLSAAFAVLAHEATERNLLAADHAVQRIVQTWRHPVLDAPMRAISALGSGVVLAPLNAGLVYLLWRRRYRNALLIPALTLAAVATEALLKWLVHRPRPKAVGYGFPSGHVMASIVFFGLVLYLLWQARHGDAVACMATAVGVTVVTGIGLSRLYLNSHWFTDVIGGGTVGLAFLIFSILRLGPHLGVRYADGAAAPMVSLPRPRVGWALGAGVVALALVDIGTRTFATNDEARFPVLAQSLLSGGHWLVPSLNGLAYVNKPPLLAWAIAAMSWPGGHVTQLTAVIPSVLAGLVTVLIVYRLGRELWNPTTGRYAAAIAATTQGLFIHARLAMPDMMLTAFAALAIWALQRMRRRPRSSDWVVFYAAVAAGFWTKGAAGLMPLGIAIGYALLRREIEPVRWLRLGPGLVVLALLLAPWTLFATVPDGDAVHQTVTVDYLHWYLPQRLSIVTFVTPLQHALSVAFPWVWLAPFAVHDAWRLRRGRGAERDAVLLTLFWAAAVLAIVAVSHQQRLRYYVPLVPPVSLLLGWWLATAVVQLRRVTLMPLSWTAALYATVAAVTVAWSLAEGRRLDDARSLLPTSAWHAAMIVVAAGTLVIAMEVGLRSRRLRPAFPVTAVAAAVLVAGLHHAEQTRRNAAHDYVGVARLAHQLRQAGEPVATLGIPVLPVAFYVGERVADLTPDAQARIGRAALAHDTALVVADQRRLREHGDPVTIGGSTTLGRQAVVIARLRGATDDTATAPTLTAGAREARAAALISSHIAFELLCLLVALAAIVGRTFAVRQGASTAVTSVFETTLILALASFPAHRLVFGAGIVGAAAYVWLRRHRPALAGRPHDLVGGLLVLALPLDVLEDALQGSHITADPIWLASALVGIALITWKRTSRPTASLLT